MDQVAKSAECPIESYNLWLLKKDGTPDKKYDHYNKDIGFDRRTNVITFKDDAENGYTQSF